MNEKQVHLLFLFFYLRIKHVKVSKPNNINHYSVLQL